MIQVVHANMSVDHVSDNTPKTITGEDRYTFDEKDFIDIKTRDGWSYRFYRLTSEEPYKLKYKRNPEGDPSDDKIVPKPIQEWFDQKSLPLTEDRSAPVLSEKGTGQTSPSKKRPKTKRCMCGETVNMRNTKCPNCGAPTRLI
jgi:hypothetical protein